MKKIKLLLTVCLMASFLAVSLAYAQEVPQNPQSSDRAKYKEQFTKELNLTPEQQTKLTENRKAQREKMTQLRKAIKEKEEKLKDALKGTDVTKAAVDPIANDIKSLQAQLIDNRIEGILAVKQILTPEQSAKFEQMMQQHRQNKGDRFKKWRENKQCGKQES